MTTHVYSTSYHSTFGNGVSLAASENLYLAAGATLSSGDANGVWGTGNSHLVNIYGNVVADNMGVWIEGSSNLVRIHDGAQIHGLGAGIMLEGYRQQINNSGYVYGSFYGVGIYSTAYGGGSSIVNKGNIEAYRIGVNRSADPAATGPLDALTLVNSGTIRALSSGAYSFASQDGADLVDIIVNTGLMDGSIDLGNGNDRIDTSKGTVVGLIDLGEGEDTASGSVKADRIEGDTGDDLIRGGGGRDWLDGGLGSDVADYRDKAVSVHVTLKGGSGVAVKVKGVVEDTIASFEGLYGGSGADQFTGDEFANLLRGNRGNDSLVGGAGNDTVSGGGGKDALTGGVGKDHFTFDVRPGSGNVDTITDFSHRDDIIGLDALIFTALTGPFSAAQFRASSFGHAATTTSQRIIYDQSNGSLWYDPDGSGSKAAIQFATLTNKPTDLSYNDFLRFEIA